jgi:predicted acylesterase/phospholipase RssA
MTKTLSVANPHRVPRALSTHKPRIGLALAGGGLLGAVYEIGALAALQESVTGLDLNDADIFVGISAGGIIAAALANGMTPHQMCRLFVESDPDDPTTSMFLPQALLTPAWNEFRRRGNALPGLLASSVIHYLKHGMRPGFAGSFERLKEALPTGILSGAGIEQAIALTFAAEGRSDDFRALKRKLVIVATDLDSGEPVRFGQAGFDHVPISRAARASACVPGLFPPVEIDGRHFVDGALRKTLHASIALDTGLDLLLCVNPIVPYNARAVHPPGKLASGGLAPVLSQTLRAIIHSRVEIGMGNYALAYPDTDIMLIEPSQDDADMFFTNLFSYNSRRRICESAYQDTRIMLWRRRNEIGRLLARHGLELNHRVLRDTSLTLVKQRVRKPAKRSAMTDLEETLDSLERYLKTGVA